MIETKENRGAEARQNVSENIVKLRTKAGLTQAEFAEKMAYSDKAVSKWERNESIPDIGVLVKISDFFGVSLDYMVSKHEGNSEDNPEGASISGSDAESIGNASKKNKKSKKTHALITAMSGCLVWVLAFLGLFAMQISNFPSWLLLVYAVPVTSIVCLVLSCIWFDRKWKYVLISVLMWSLILSIFLTMSIVFNVANSWLLFVACVPGQAIILLWSGINFIKK